MTHAQRSHMLRRGLSRIARLEAELRAARAALAPIEAEHARAIGMPTLRGAMLLNAMDREDAIAAKRMGRAA